MKTQTPTIATLTLLLACGAVADDVAAMKKLEAEEWTVPGIELKMKRIPAGTFTMGSPEDEIDRRADEAQHEVTISKPFYIGIYEVTQGQYYDIMAPNYDHDSWPYARGPLHDGLALFYRERKHGRDYQGGKLRLQCPMECVTWHKAVEFCGKITEQERKAGRLPDGYVYRLPTEAEWEYACRAGAKSPFNVKAEKDTAEYLKSEEFLKTFANIGEGAPIDVGKGEPNAWGLYDMHGNVYEWCLDTYASYPTEHVTDPVGPAPGTNKVNRVARGGCFDGPAPYSPPGVIARADSYSGSGPFIRSASRYQFDPDVNFYAILGFRVVLGKAVAER